MTEVTNTSQLSTFNLFRTILLSSSTISTKFKSSDFYQFEPKHKANNVSFPYIVLSIPTVDNALDFIGDVTNEKEFSVICRVVIEWQARDNMVNYLNAIVSVLDASVQTLKSSGYNYESANITFPPEAETIHQKECVSGEVLITYTAEVKR